MEERFFRVFSSNLAEHTLKYLSSTVMISSYFEPCIIKHIVTNRRSSLWRRDFSEHFQPIKQWWPPTVMTANVIYFHIGLSTKRSVYFDTSSIRTYNTWFLENVMGVWSIFHCYDFKSKRKRYGKKAMK